MYVNDLYEFIPLGTLIDQYYGKTTVFACIYVVIRHPHACWIVKIDRQRWPHVNSKRSSPKDVACIQLE